MNAANIPNLGEPEPTWNIAQLFPAQGHWDEDKYLALETNHLIEYTRGNLEVLVMPTWPHQLTVLTLHGEHYVEHGAFAGEEQADSPLFAGFVVDVASVFMITDQQTG